MRETTHLNMKSWYAFKRFKRTGIQIWEFWMFKMSDVGSHIKIGPTIPEKSNEN